MRRRLTLTVLAGVVGCSPPSLEDTPCPPEGTTLSYDNFGETFFAAHCVHCHGGSQGTSSRGFASVTRIREDRERIFTVAAADNPSMPPGPEDPSPEDRERLTEWLSCGAP